MTSVEILNSSLVPDSFSWVSLVGDCEVGATRKACKNCSCGRAEAEAKVEKLELTAEQINNPQSACGSVSIASRISVPLFLFVETPLYVAIIASWVTDIASGDLSERFLQCGLGDAFRCGTCPYRGLPPFKPGEKVIICI